MATNRWPQKKLKVIVKGQKGGGGKGGMTITNAEIEDILDRMSDDHDPGQAEGKGKEIPDDVKDDAGKAGGQIDENGKKVDDAVAEGADKAANETEREAPDSSGPSKNS